MTAVIEPSAGRAGEAALPTPEPVLDIRDLSIA